MVVLSQKKYNGYPWKNMSLPKAINSITGFYKGTSPVNHLLVFWNKHLKYFRRVLSAKPAVQLYKRIYFCTIFTFLALAGTVIKSAAKERKVKIYNDVIDDRAEFVEPVLRHSMFEVTFDAAALDSYLVSTDDDTRDLPLEFFQQNPNRRPKIIANSADIQQESTYALLMLDPDCPSAANPILADLLLWGLYNIPARLLVYQVFEERNLLKKQTLFETLFRSSPPHSHVFANYKAPAPRRETGPHRYHVILLEQMRGVSEGIPLVKNRTSFRTADFLALHGMREVIRATFTVTNSAKL